MNGKVYYGIAGLAVALSGCAQAQLSYAAGSAFAAGADYIESTVAPSVLDFAGFFDAATGYGADLRTFVYNSSFNTAAYPSIDSWSTSCTLRTQAAPDRFEFSYDGHWSGGFNQTPPPEITNLTQTGATADISYTITADADTRVRVSWDYATDGYIGQSNPIRNFSSIANNTLAGDAIAPIAFGYGLSGLITTPFSFEVDMLAGQSLQVHLFTDNFWAIDSLADPLLSWDQHETGSFVIEIVTPCLGDLDGNGVLNLDDVNLFAMAYIAGCP